MNIRDLAAQDFLNIVNDQNSGFGVPVALISPDGNAQPLSGLTTDISSYLDPETGVLVAGRVASVTFANNAIREAGFSEMPVAVADSNKRPWVVCFRDPEGIPYLFKVVKAMPDRAISGIVLELEVYKRSIYFDGAYKFDGTTLYDGVLDLL